MYSPVADYIKTTVDTILGIHREQPAGDILAFLTGQVHICYFMGGRSASAKTLPEVLNVHDKGCAFKTKGKVFLNMDRPRLENNIFIFCYHLQMRIYEEFLNLLMCADASQEAWIIKTGLAGSQSECTLCWDSGLQKSCLSLTDWCRDVLGKRGFLTVLGKLVTRALG